MSEGTVFQRSTDGRWCAKYKDARGNWKYLYRRSKGEAKQALRKALKDRDEGVSPNSMTLSVYLNEWLEDIEENVSYRTWLNHECIVRLHLNPTIGDKKLSKLSPKDIHDLYRSKLNSGLSRGRVRKIHVTLNLSLKNAVRFKYISMNPATDVKPPQEYSREMDVLTPEQVKALLNAAKGDRLEAAYVLPVVVGLRQGECLALRYEDIDFDRGTLKVRRTVWRNNVYPPKTPHSRRTIKLPRIALNALKRHRDSDSNGDGWLFPTKHGNPVDAHNFIHRPWKRMLRKAGLPETTRYHDLRHGAASLLIASGVPIPIISNLLGHRDSSITLKVYAHVIKGMDDMAADTMDALLE